jgi:hypothetical protein
MLDEIAKRARAGQLMQRHETSSTRRASSRCKASVSARICDILDALDRRLAAAGRGVGRWVVEGFAAYGAAIHEPAVYLHDASPWQTMKDHEIPNPGLHPIDGPESLENRAVAVWLEDLRNAGSKTTPYLP